MYVIEGNNLPYNKISPFFHYISVLNNRAKKTREVLRHVYAKISPLLS